MPRWESPEIGLLIKLGSAIVHADECLGPDGRVLDQQVFQELIKDAEVKAWLEQGTRMALLPVKRT